MSGAPLAFITYNGLLDPLGASQVVPYLELLAREWPLHVISYERRERLGASGVESMARRLERQRIGWTRLSYHKRPSLLAKSWDLASGTRALKRLLRQRDVGLVHARGYFPMEVASRAAGRTPVIFDIRGLHGEEYVEGGIWSGRDLRYRLLKRSEARYFARADAAVVLTRAILPYVRERFQALGRNPPIEVIPTCVDTSRFRFDSDGRREHRARFGADDDTVVFVYSGSLGTWYMADEMARFVRVFGERTGRDVFLFWQVNTGQEMARSASTRAGLRAEQVHIQQARPDEVPLQLSAADVGLALIRPTFSKRASAPTKYGEYLAVGIPVLFSVGVGDSEELARHGVGVGIDSFDDDGYGRASDALIDLLGAGRDVFRSFASRMFGLEEVAGPAYRRLYGSILEPRGQS